MNEEITCVQARFLALPSVGCITDTVIDFSLCNKEMFAQGLLCHYTGCCYVVFQELLTFVAILTVYFGINTWISLLCSSSDLSKTLQLNFNIKFIAMV